MKKGKVLLTAIILCCQSTTYAGELQQVVSSESANIDMSMHNSIEIPIYYSTSDYNTQLSGFGLRVHYDQDKIDLHVNQHTIYPKGFVAIDTLPDTENYDNDITTTHYKLLSWFDIDAQWPGSELPLLLCNINIESQSNTGYSSIKFTSSSTARNYTLSSEPININF